jgi:hypothetical protein
MSDKFNRIVESFFAREEKVFGINELKDLLERQANFKTLNKRNLLSEKSLPAPSVIQSKPKEKTITYNSIADIAVSELGWSSLETKEGESVSDTQRKQLEQYLKNIGGNTFDEKIKAVNSFYTMSVEDLEKTGLIKAESRSSKIQQMLSYLVFLKTLTTIVTNFNASSAGFAFESFLGVLLGGKQIPATGAKTIADVTLNEGGETIYASLKLYSEKSLKVGGSFRDLCNDMIDPNKKFIRYITGLKNLTGDGLDREGVISFYKFDFNRDNVMDILVQTSDASKSCIVLPLDYIKSNGQTNFENITSVEVTEQQIRDEFLNVLDNVLYRQAFKKLPAAKRDELVKNTLEILTKKEKESSFFLATKSKEKKLGYANISDAAAKDVIEKLQESESDLKIRKFLFDNKKKLSDLIKNIYKETIKSVAKASAPEAADKAIKTIKWSKPEQAAEFYKNLSSEEKAKALKNTLGYLRERQFEISKSQMFAATATGGEKIGEIIIGRKNIQNLLNNVSDQIDSTVFDIFDSLSVLTQNINRYFATGLEDNQAADIAQEAAVNIDKKTEEVQAKTNA